MASLPLEGIRVVDMTHNWAGPHCTRILADYGAEVIRVEHLRRLCMFRGGFSTRESCNHQPTWFQVNRNKRCITLNLKTDRDRQTLYDLVRRSDMLIESGRSGVPERLGYGYETLRKIKQDFIMISMSAFGNSGPHATYPAYGAVLEVMGGIQNLTGYGATQTPQRIREMDVTNGVGGACAAMTALLHRAMTGEGQHIDLSQMELPMHSLIGAELLEYAMTGAEGRAHGNRSRLHAPQGCYPCAGEDQWVTLTVRTETEWAALCDTLGHPEWKADPLFRTLDDRRRNHDELDRRIGQWTLTQTPAAAMRTLQERGIPAGAVLDMPAIATDPHLQARQYFVNNVEGSDKTFMGLPFRMSRTPGAVRWSGRDLGADNEYVLCSLLNRPKSEVPVIRDEDIGTSYDPD